MSNYTLMVAKDYSPETDDNILDSIFKQYEGVIIQSLITSFGLDFLINDRHGGDVDTIHNVRQIGQDEKMEYKNKNNAVAYIDRGAYDSHEYHSHNKYIEKNR